VGGLEAARRIAAMSSFYFRYAWISKEVLGRCFPASPEIVRLTTLLEERDHLLRQQRCNVDALQHADREVKRVVRWFAQPSFLRLPSQKTIRLAHAQLDSARHAPCRALVQWVECAAKLIRSSDEDSGPPHGELLGFLEAISRTAFPVLLLWTQPRLAARMFREDSGGAVSLSPPYRRASHVAVQAAHTCIGYALGAVGRLAPRQAWVGAGFGVFAGADGESLRVEPAREEIHVVPDLAWVERNWRDLAPLPLLPGTLPWDYLRRRIAAQSDGEVRRKYSELLAALRRLARAVERNPWSYDAVQRFQRDAEALLSGTVDARAWTKDPHRWWITRLLSGEHRLGQSIAARLRATFIAHRRRLVTRGLLLPRESRVHESRLPYPERVKQCAPERVLMEAEELADWAVAAGSDGGARLELPYLPKVPPGDPGWTYWVDERGTRFQYLDPNARRSAEYHAAFLETRPLFSAGCSRTALQPPSTLIDNRLVRLEQPEREPSTVRVGDAVAFYSTLLVPETASLFALELLGPDYAEAADIVPLLLDFQEEAAPSFGRICRTERVWLLERGEARRMASTLKTGRKLATFYHLEVHDTLGRPMWLDAVIDGKRSSLPTHSVAAYDYLLHVLGTTEAAVSLVAPRTAPGASPAFMDAEGNPLPVQLICRLQHEKGEAATTDT
jgi:hypothetical protein